MNNTAVAPIVEVPFVDLQAQWKALAPEIRPVMERVLARANFILGDEVEEFEKEFAAFIGTKYCVGVGSGTDAIMLALEACGIGPGDEVLVPANTYVATVSAICHRGARPVFVDMDPDSFCMDFLDMQAKWTASAKAVGPVHLYGRAMDLQEILAWAKGKRMRVIEDACQAHGARTVNGKAGALGDVGCFSFYPGKNLGCYGDGGAITTNDAEIASVVARLRNQGQREKYIHDCKGYNSRLDTLQAAVLRVKLRHLESWNRARRQWAMYYRERLADVSGVNCPALPQAGPEAHVFHLYVVRTAARDALLRRLRQNGVSAQIHYPIPVHLAEGYRDLGFGPGDMPVAEKAAAEILSLPLYPELAQEQADYVVEQIRQFFRK